MNPKLSIIIPSIHPENVPFLYDQIKKSVLDYSFEVIVVGPYFLPKELEEIKNIKYIRSFASPAKCFQLAGLFCEGEYLTWVPDDIKIDNESHSKCIDVLSTLNYKDIIIIRYNEGENYSGNQSNWAEYWRAVTHDSLKLKQINKDWAIAPIFMVNTNYFRELGGVDAENFEHSNLNHHDFCFRAQLNGSKMYFSPTKVFSADWVDPRTGKHNIVQKAYDENDLPNFNKIWNADILDRPIKIDYNNYLKAPILWGRRFKE